MENNKFVLVSLEDEKSKELAEVIANKTSRKILELLAEKELSESDISKRLDIPLNTVHYNVQNLLKNNLIEPKRFVWSEKGKKINLYKLANKLIIIAPKTESYFIDKLKTIISVALIGFIASGVIYLFSRQTYVASEFSMVREAMLSTPVPALQISQPNYALWFLAGVLATIVLYITISYWRSRK